jgi:hypothetical protein
MQSKSPQLIYALHTACMDVNACACLFPPEAHRIRSQRPTHKTESSSCKARAIASHLRNHFTSESSVHIRASLVVSPTVLCVLLLCVMRGGVGVWFYAFYAFYAWWIYFPQRWRALAHINSIEGPVETSLCMESGYVAPVDVGCLTQIAQQFCAAILRKQN